MKYKAFYKSINFNVWGNTEQEAREKAALLVEAPIEEIRICVPMLVQHSHIVTMPTTFFLNFPKVVLTDSMEEFVAMLKRNKRLAEGYTADLPDSGIAEVFLYGNYENHPLYLSQELFNRACSIRIIDEEGWESVCIKDRWAKYFEAETEEDKKDAEAELLGTITNITEITLAIRGAAHNIVNKGFLGGFSIDDVPVIDTLIQFINGEISQERAKRDFLMELRNQLK